MKKKFSKQNKNIQVTLSLLSVFTLTLINILSASIIYSNSLSPTFTSKLIWPRDNSVIASQFVRIVTVTENSEKSPNSVTKWPSSIKLLVVGDVRKSSSHKINSHIKLLRSLGVDINLVSQAEGARTANMVVRFVDRKDFLKIASARWPKHNFPACFGTNQTISNKKNSGTIFKSNIYIPIDLKDNEISSCIEEEITQSLGLLNDSYELIDSLFNDENLYEELSPIDKLFIALLYHQGIDSGLDKLSLYNKTLSSLNELFPKNFSNKPYDLTREKKITTWEKMVHLAFFDYSQKKSLNRFYQQNNFATSIPDSIIIMAQAEYFLGKFLNVNGQYQEARKHLIASDKIFRANIKKTSLKYANLMYELGLNKLRLNEYPQAIIYLENLKKILANLDQGVTQLKAKTNISLIEAYNFNKDKTKLDLLAKQILSDEYTKTDDKLITLYYYGFSFLEQGQKQQALKNYESMKQLYSYLPKELQKHRQELLRSYQQSLQKLISR